MLKFSEKKEQKEQAKRKKKNGKSNGRNLQEHHKITTPADLYRYISPIVHTDINSSGIYNMINGGGV